MHVRSLNTEVEKLNSLSRERAEAEFLTCCGSKRWAAAMTAARPFKNVDDLLNNADHAWWSLSERDWLEAFRAHPRIGETAAVVQSKAAQEWSAQEQSGAKDASPATMAALAVGNREYEERFGFIFIICATGKTSNDMLAALHSRLRNKLESELRIAVDEQRKITRLRLKKLLSTRNL